jgi:auxin efflux carrier family protein
MGLFNYITAPTSYQNAQAFGLLARREQVSLASTAATVLQENLPPHSQHPNFGHLTLLVFEAVLEVVCVSLPGYIVARRGLFDAESQKFLANLNVALFTPCLSITFRFFELSLLLIQYTVFTKLASQLTAEKLVDLAIIPFIFVIQTLISYLCAWGVSKGLGLKKRQKNFIIAMGVRLPSRVWKA